MAPFKFAASQARSIHNYKNLKIKVLKCNADIFFNWQCLTKKIIPNYTNIKVPITSLVPSFNVNSGISLDNNSWLYLNTLF